MARVVGQSIPADLYAQYKYKMMPAVSAGFYYYLSDYQYGYASIVRTKIPRHLPGRYGVFFPSVSANEESTRLAFSRSCKILKYAPRTGTVSPPLSGPRSREWWFNNAPGTFFIWTNYFHKETLPFTRSRRRPAWGISDDFYVCDTENSRVVHRHCNTWNFINKRGSWNGGPGQFKLPWFITDSGHYLYISDPLNYRISILDRNNLSWINSFTAYDYGKKTLGIVSGIASEGDTLFVGTADAGGVLLIDAQTRLSKGSFTARGPADSETILIIGVAADHDYIYVSDTINHNIKIFRRSNFTCLATLGTGGSGVNQFNSPYGIDVDRDFLYVADSGNSRVVKLSKPDLSWIRTAGPGQDVEIDFSDCSDVAISGDYLLVTDRQHHRVCRLIAANLEFDSEYGTEGEGDDNFNYPIGICARSQVYE